MSFIYSLWVSATAHFLISMLVSTTCRYLGSFFLFPRRGFIWHPSFRLSRVSLLPIFTGFFTLMLCCRPLKICNISDATCQEPQPAAGIKLSEDFSSCTFVHVSPRHIYVVGLLINTARPLHFSLVGGPCQKEKSNKSKHRICQSYCSTAFVTEAKDGLFLYRNLHKKGP